MKGSLLHAVVLQLKLVTAHLLSWDWSGGCIEVFGGDEASGWWFFLRALPGISLSLLLVPFVFLPPPVKLGGFAEVLCCPEAHDVAVG